MSKEEQKSDDEWVVELEVHRETMTFSVKQIYQPITNVLNPPIATIPFITVTAKDEIGAFSIARGKLHCLGLNPVA